MTDLFKPVVAVCLALLIAACQDPALAPVTDAAEDPPSPPTMSRVPLTCDELFPLDVRAALTGIEQFNTYDTTDPGQLGQQARLTQAGGIECAWFGQAIGNSSTTMDIVLGILPGVTTEISDYRQAYPVTDSHTEVVRDTFGEGSVVSCDSYAEIAGFVCSVDVLVADGYLISGVVTTQESVGGAAGVSDFFLGVENRLRAASGASILPFEPPADTFGIGLDCDAITASPAFQQRPVLAMLAPAQDADIATWSIYRAASHRVGASICTWPVPDEAALPQDPILRTDPLTITITPGSEWAWDGYAETLAVAAAADGDFPFDSVTIPGTVTALAQDFYDRCTLLALIDHSIVTIEDRGLAESDDNCADAIDVLEILLALD